MSDSQEVGGIAEVVSKSGWEASTFDVCINSLKWIEDISLYAWGKRSDDCPGTPYMSRLLHGI